MHSPEKQQTPALQQVSTAEQAQQAPVMAPPPFALTTSSEGEQDSGPSGDIIPGTDQSIQHAEASADSSGEGTPWQAPQFGALPPPEFKFSDGEKEEGESGALVENDQPQNKAVQEETPPGGDGGADSPNEGGASSPPPVESNSGSGAEQPGGGNGATGAGAGGGADGAVGSTGGGTGFEQAAVSLDSSSMGSLVQSVGSQQPTGMVLAMGQAGGELGNAQSTEAEKAKEMLPEIEQPTGLEVGGEGKEAAGNELKKAETPEVKTKETGEKQEVSKDVVEAKGATPADKVATPAKEAISTPENYGAAITSIPEVDGEVDTSAGPRPQVKLQGDLNPARNDAAQSEGDASMLKSKGEADQQTKKDFGEKNILPNVEKEMMKTETEISAGEGYNGQVGVLPEMDPQTAAALNSGIMNQHQAEISAEMAKQTEGEANYQSEAQAAQEKGLADIEAENEKIKQQQLEARKEGETEISKHRADWTTENEKVRSKYESQSKSKRAEIEGQIQAKVAETNSKVETEYSKAEGQALAKTKDAQGKIAAKKEEEQKKKKKKSWWQKAIDAVGDFFKKLKEAVSGIFNALRKAVSAIISAVKDLAGKLIDMARNAIKGLIDAFADMLKGFIRLALAAFPELADRFCNLIDSVVEKVKNAVDALADGLKAAVNFILDGIGSAINALLSAYESLINGILGALEFLVVGFLKIMEGIANLVKSAIGSPDFFIGQASEELMGQDMTAPLQNEYPEMAMPDVAAEVPTMEPDVSGMNESVGGGDGAGELLAKSSYTAEDFSVPVLENPSLDPQLIAQFSAMGEGEHDLGGFEDGDHGMEALKAELGHEPSAVPQSMNESTATGEMETPAAAGPTSLDPGRDRFTADSAGMVGPFSVGERAKFVGGQMIDGIRGWIAEKWPSIVAALIGIIGGAILANILTGGAIMAALPLVMQLLGAYFAADAIMNLAKHFGQYLSKSFPGDIQGGSKSLARGLAIGAIELVFALLFGAKGAFKAAKGAAKTVAKQGVKGAMKTGVKTAGQAAKASVKGTVNAAVQLGKVAKNGAKTAGKNMVKGGKFVMGGLKKGALSGAKTVDDLMKRMGKAFKFKGFKLRIRAKRWNLFGIINPEVLVANGDVTTVPRGAGGLGNKVDELGGFVLSQGDNVLTGVIKSNPELGKSLHSLLSRTDIRPKSLLKAMDGLEPDEVADLIKQLDEFKNLDEAILKQALDDHRALSQITKKRKVSGTGFDGGTVGAGKPKIDNLDLADPDKIYTGASTNAQTPPSSHNTRYQSPQKSTTTWNHAEQTILGDLANDIDNALAKVPGMTADKVKGTVSLTVDQAVCSACRQGFSGNAAAGVVKQFVDQYPGLRLIISNTQAGMKGSELLIIQGGKILGK